jgi:isopenicillin-N epimerase
VREPDESAPALRHHWSLDPAIAFLNHGSFGACPISVLDEQRGWRERIERQPVQFFVRDFGKLLDEARSELAEFLGADAPDLVFVPNATAGVNAVLRSLHFEAGDELLTTDHAYNAVGNAMRFVAERAGARVVVAQVPFPVSSPEAIVDRVLEAVTPRTRIAVLDHVTSPTAVVFPIADLTRALSQRGIDTLVDGAHAAGMLPLDLRAVGSAYYTGNCHKWLCAPKGAGFLYVRRDLQPKIRPLSISHGANAAHAERSRYLLEFDWTGTDDPTPYLSIPASIRFMGGLVDGGWPEVRRRNHELVCEARRRVCARLGIEPPCPDAMLGSMATIAIADGTGEPPRSALYTDPLQTGLLQRHRIEVPFFPWPAPPRRWVRFSAQLYKTVEEYDRLAQALVAEAAV